MTNKILLYIFVFLTIVRGIQGQINASNAPEVVRTAIQNAARSLGTRGQTAALGNRSQSIVPGDVQLQWLNSKRNVNNNRIQTLSDQSSVIQNAAEHLAKTHNLDPSRIFEDSVLTREFNQQIQRVCQYQRPPCDPQYPYRLPDGTCNNLLDSLLGASVTPLQRVVSSRYEGINNPRSKSTNNQDNLPSPRLVSNEIHDGGGIDRRSGFITALFTHWGQFVSHDIVSTPIKLGPIGRGISCCPYVPGTSSGECAPIAIPLNDPRFGNQSCMNFVRSESAPPLECVFAPRQQVNQRTAFLDASAQYGNSKEQEDQLRDLSSRGLMKTSSVYNLLPSTRNPTSSNECRIDQYDANVGARHCFDAGDHRNSENPALTTIHTLLLREHNRIASILGRMNPHWTNETVYQESKKIVMATLQHITYNEFLPILLNDQEVLKYGLRSTPAGFSTVYNDQLDPRVINGFSVGAIPFLYSLVTASLGHADLNFTTIRNFTLGEHYYRPLTIWMGEGRGAEFFARWMSTNPKAKSDRLLDPNVRDYFLFDVTSGKSFDIAALTIQRGRDHGLPGYNAYRQYCGLPPVYYFGTGQFGLRDHDADVIQKLRTLYKTPEDIDLFVGGMTEKPLAGSLVGPTLSCLIGLQFHLLKFGDRFWYENGFMQTGFTLDQLNSIKQQSLAKLLCRNFNIRELQPAAFIMPSSQANRRIACTQFSDLNLALWREQPPPVPLPDGVPLPPPFNPALLPILPGRGGAPAPAVPTPPTQPTPTTQSPPFNPQMLQILRDLI